MHSSHDTESTFIFLLNRFEEGVANEEETEDVAEDTLDAENRVVKSTPRTNKKKDIVSYIHSNLKISRVLIKTLFYFELEEVNTKKELNLLFI